MAKKLPVLLSTLTILASAISASNVCAATDWENGPWSFDDLLTATLNARAEIEIKCPKDDGRIDCVDHEVLGNKAAIYSVGVQTFQYRQFFVAGIDFETGALDYYLNSEDLYRNYHMQPSQDDPFSDSYVDYMEKLRIVQLEKGYEGDWVVDIQNSAENPHWKLLYDGTRPEGAVSLLPTDQRATLYINKPSFDSQYERYLRYYYLDTEGNAITFTNNFTDCIDGKKYDIWQDVENALPYFKNFDYDEGYEWGYNVGYTDGLNGGYTYGYDSGFINGQFMGYDEGYAAGYAAGLNDGSSTAFNDGYNTGLNEGYSVGYDEGYTNGLNEGHSTGLDEGYGNGYDAGYGVGYNDGSSIGYNAGYGDGLSEGHDDGYYEGLNSGYDTGYDNGYNDGYLSGYDVGYNRGIEEGTTAINSATDTPTDDTSDLTDNAPDLTNSASDSTDDTSSSTNNMANSIDSATDSFATAIATSGIINSNDGLLSTVSAKTSTISAPNTGAPTAETGSVELPWWLLTIFAFGVATFAWLFWPKKSRKGVDKSKELR